MKKSRTVPSVNTSKYGRSPIHLISFNVRLSLVAKVVVPYASKRLSYLGNNRNTLKNL